MISRATAGQTLPSLDSATRRQWRIFIALTGSLSVLALITMTIGPYVRAEDAGLSCPDWPLCYGKVIPPYEYRVYLEFIHRSVAGVMSLTFLAWLFYLGWVRTLRRVFLAPAGLALGLLALQILLGGATITQRLEAYIVKSHLVNALLYLSTLVYIWKKAEALLQRPEKDPAAPDRPMHSERSFRRQQGLALALVFLQIYLGGRVSAHEAGLDCPEFPACYAQKVTDGDQARTELVFFPSLNETYERPMTHRWLGFGLFFFALWLMFRTRGTPLGSKNATFFAMLCVQILLGALIVKWQLPTPVRVLHSLTAITLYLTALINLLDLQRYEFQRN